MNGRVVAYYILMGEKVSAKPYEVLNVEESHHITGLLALAQAAQIAIDNPDKRVTVEIVTG
jgi:hypothetical protein